MRRAQCKKMAFASITVILGLACASAIGEVGLRLLGYKGAPESVISNIYEVDDSILNWRYVPGSEVQQGKVLHKYNSIGFRDVDHALQKPTGIKRVVIVGDSVTDAGGVEQEAMFSTRLQVGLGPTYEVITLAMGGLNTPQEVHLLEKEGLPYKPDLVILNFVLNDADFHTEYHATKRYHSDKDNVVGILGLPINPSFKRALKSSSLVYFVKQRFEHVYGLIQGNDKTDYFDSLWNKAENRKKVTDSFDQLQRMSESSAFRVLIIIWPILTQFPNYKFDSIHHWVSTESEARGFKVLDLLPHFSLQSYRKLQITAEDNVHPNHLGHEIAAEAFLDWARKNNLR